jgi:hypothetical protein
MLSEGHETSSFTELRALPANGISSPSLSFPSHRKGRDSVKARVSEHGKHVLDLPNL